MASPSTRDQGPNDRQREHPLRVALVSPAWPREVFPNGIVGYVDGLARGLVEEGHAVEILTHVEADVPDEPPVVDLGAFESREGITLKLKDRARKLLRQDDPPLMRHARAIAAALSARSGDDAFDLLEIEESFGVAGFMPPEQSVPVVTRLHGPWSVNGRVYGVPIDRAFEKRAQDERRAALGVAGLTSPSQAILDLTREAWQADLPHARVIFNPAPIVEAQRRWRREEADAETLLYVGRFDRIKGADTLLEAFDRVARERPGLRLVFIGPDDGVVDDAGKRWSLKTFIRTRLSTPGIEGRIDDKGFLPPHEIESHRQRATLTLVTSRFETSCNALTEAMAYGCPVIASRAGGMPEMLEDGVTGRLFEAENAEALAEAIRWNLDHREEAASMAAAAARDTVARLAPDHIARQTVDYYRSVIERTQSRGTGTGHPGAPPAER